MEHQEIRTLEVMAMEHQEIRTVAVIAMEHQETRTLGRQEGDMEVGMELKPLTMVTLETTRTRIQVAAMVGEVVETSRPTMQAETVGATLEEVILEPTLVVVTKHRTPEEPMGEEAAEATLQEVTKDRPLVEAILEETVEATLEEVTKDRAPEEAMAEEAAETVGSKVEAM